MDDPILLGEGGAYTLNPRAFRHIMEGDYKQKVDRPLAGGNPILSIAIAGGVTHLLCTNGLPATPSKNFISRCL